LLAVGAFCPHLHAGWSSLQGNNRSAPARPSAPRPQPGVVRVPELRQAVNPVVREQTHIVERVQPAPMSVDRTRAVVADRQRMDVDEDRRQSFFWSDFHAGMRIDNLPDGYLRIGVRGHPFFYFEGVFYDDGPSGYVTVAPPVDAVISELPPGAETVTMGDTVYYYAAGAFYIQQPDGSYVVVAAPMGVTVTLLPPDATPVVINGTTCYQADGTYYQPVMQNGVTAYLTIAQP